MIWFLSFPREMGFPNRVLCRSPEEFFTTLNRYNGIINKIYIGLYEKREDNKINLNVAAYDIDGPEAFDNMKIMHATLQSEGIMHQLMYSTGGYWVFVMLKPELYEKSLAKRKLETVQMHFAEKSGLKYGKSKDAALDAAIRGDVERIFRCPFSMDKSRNRNVLFLTDEDIEQGHEYIMKMSSENKDKRNLLLPYFKGNVFDPESIPLVEKKYESSCVEFDINDYNTEIPQDSTEMYKGILAKMPDFIRAWVINKDRATFETRYYATIWMREAGFPQDFTEKFLCSFYDKYPRTDSYGNNGEHYRTVKVAELVYRRKNELLFPNNKTLVEMGLAPTSILDDGKQTLTYR